MGEHEPSGQNGTSSKYPQINLNTAFSSGIVVMLVGAVIYIAGIKAEVTSQDRRLMLLESQVIEINAARFQQARSDTALEGRLSRIETLLQTLLKSVNERRVP